MYHLPKPPRINNALTRRVAQLHHQGYGFDFGISGNQELFCMQDNRSFTRDALSITLVDQVYDKLFKQFKYVHTVEAESGEKGILLINFIHLGASPITIH